MTIEISPIASRTWDDFVRSFTRQNDGWIGSVEVRSQDGKLSRAVEELPFRGVTLEKRGGRETMILTFGYDPDEHHGHLLDAPKALTLVESRDHNQKALIVDLGDGAECVLELLNPFSDFVEF